MSKLFSSGSGSSSSSSSTSCSSDSKSGCNSKKFPKDNSMTGSSSLEESWEGSDNDKGCPKEEDI